MYCSVPLVYVHISSRDRAKKKNKCQQTHCRGEFWETQLNQLAITKSSVKFNPENDINVKLQILNFTFKAITYISSMRICQQHQRIEVIYYSPFVFLGRVASTVIFFNRGKLLTQQSFSMRFVTGHTTYYGFLLSCLRCTDTVHSMSENKSDIRILITPLVSSCFVHSIDGYTFYFPWRALSYDTVCVRWWLSSDFWSKVSIAGLLFNYLLRNE